VSELPRTFDLRTIPTETWVLPRPRPDAYVGGFPLHFERRLWELLGRPERVLHPFGGLAEIGDTVDLNATTTPTWVGDAHDLHWIADESYDLVILDPPYSEWEAEWLYSTPPPRWGDYTREAVRVCSTDGFVAVYLDKQPARPEGTRLVLRIVVLTRTWHTPRVCFVFRKLGSERLVELAARNGTSHGQQRLFELPSKRDLSRDGEGTMS
jgi:hypothetical protein